MNHSQIEHGTSVRDPVCGMNVDPKSTPHTGSFGGQTHFFCSQNCLAKFRSAPERYVSTNPATRKRDGAISEGAVEEYTCPMHPEVRQQGPGACPKCGMALEPVAPSASQTLDYVCPMHPEIVRSEPGNCPICGMALEPRTPPRPPTNRIPSSPI